jgi:cell division protein FtsB
MRWLALALFLLLGLLQYPLWFGKGGWLKVWEYDRQLQQYQEQNKKLEMRNAGMEAEVRDLRQGYGAVEERARFDLGMVKPGEIFIAAPAAPEAEGQGSPGKPR